MHENVNLQYKTIFISFCQNTAEFYFKHILLTKIGIFWPEFGFKRRYFALVLTENGNLILDIAPSYIRYLLPTVALYPNVQSTMLIRSVSKGEQCTETFPFSVRCNAK